MNHVVDIVLIISRRFNTILSLDFWPSYQRFQVKHANGALRKEGKKWKKVDSLKSEDYPDTEEGIENFAVDLMQKTSEIFKKCTKSRLRTPKSANQSAIDLLNSISNDEINNQKASTTMYGFVELMTGPGETTERSKPTLEEFKKLVE